MPKELNATCSICGSKYHVCNTCKSVKTLKPWRTITDTIDCYKIYMIIHDYTNKVITKEKACEMLNHCSIPSNLQTHIQKTIDEIIGFEKKNKKEQKKGLENNLTCDK